MSDAVEILKDPATRAQYAKLPPEYRAAFEWRTNWLLKAHAYQITPAGDWWDIWLLLAGRGAGKTRTAAEQLGWWAWQNPNTRWVVAAPTSSDVRSTCFEGDSGLLSVIPPALVKDYNKALHELTLINGSLIKGIPASEPERFRGPQFHGGWCIPPHTMIALPDGSEKAVQFVQPGDFVMTRHGPRKVLASGVSGNPSGLVSIRCGESLLTTTDDHPILIDNQWIPAGDIKVGDWAWRASFTTASHGIEDRAGISTIRNADTFTDMSGNALTAQFKKASLFTTLITTPATTISQTCRSWQSQIIKGTTGLVGRIAKFKKPQRGKRLSLSERLSLLAAFFVTKTLFPFLQTKWAGFAPAHVWIDGETTANIQSKRLASNVAVTTSRYEKATSYAQPHVGKQWRFDQVQVSSVERLPNSLTYNLTVEGEHEFIANGIVVHNCDELAAWEYLQDAWDMMQFGLRLGKKVRLICTTTPKPKDLILDLVDRQGDDVALVTASTYENLDNLADNFRKQILQYEGTKLGRQEIYAELIDPEEGGMVKREHFRLWPVNKPFPKFEYIIQSYDCAYTEKTVNDPTAATTWGVFKPQDGPMSVMLIDAWQDRLQYPDLRPKVIEEFKVSFGADPEEEERGNFVGGKKVDLILIEDKAAGISLIQDLQRAYLPVRAYNPGRADKIQRLSIVSNIISHKRVWIPESSTRKGYVRDWAEGFVSQICSFPESTHDDFVDSCLIGSTQVLMADGSEKRLDKVVVGDMVKTPNGAQQVVKTFNNGEKEIWMVSAGGQMLLGTGDHRVMTGRGWIRIDSLIPNEDTVFMYPREVIWRSQRNLRSLPRRFTSTVGSTTATLKARIQRIANTLQGLALDCIGMFGITTTAVSPMGTTFITLMATPATTTSATLNASQPQITGQSIEKSCESETLQIGSGSTLTESEAKPLTGTSQTKAASGIVSTRLTLWQRLGTRLVSIPRLLCSVSGAVATWLQRRLGGFIAAPNAKLPKASSALVKAVFNTHTTQTVYDLTVDEEHCYYADGMLVHNCTQALRYLRDAGFLDIDPRLEEDQEVEYYGRKKGNPYSV